MVAIQGSSEESAILRESVFVALLLYIWLVSDVCWSATVFATWSGQVNLLSKFMVRGLDSETVSY